MIVCAKDIHHGYNEGFVNLVRIYMMLDQFFGALPSAYTNHTRHALHFGEIRLVRLAFG
jgi:hypothetical protein